MKSNQKEGWAFIQVQGTFKLCSLSKILSPLTTSGFLSSSSSPEVKSHDNHTLVTISSGSHDNHVTITWLTTGVDEVFEHLKGWSSDLFLSCFQPSKEECYNTIRVGFGWEGGREGGRQEAVTSRNSS